MAIVRIQQRRDTAANWTSVNPTLADGEFGIEKDTRKFKIGDGTTAWNSLGYGTLSATNPTFSGTVTATTFSGGLTGNADTATLASTATKMPSGTSFPSSPAAGQMFLRTDQSTVYVYTGAAWATVGGAGIETFLLMGA